MNVLRESMIGQVTSDLTLLPEEDLPLVVEFVDYLKDRRKRKTPQPLSVAEFDLKPGDEPNFSTRCREKRSSHASSNLLKRSARGDRERNRRQRGLAA